MAKRGESRPWKVDYVWTDTGVHGRIACGSESEAQDRAAVIRGSAIAQDRDVSVSVVLVRRTLR